MVLMNTILFILFGSSLGAHPHCVDESGDAVDWYIVYKFPYLSHSHSKLFGGYRYATLTSKSPVGWQLSSHNITDHKNSIFAKTLSPVYSSKSVSSVFYNDQPPDDKSVSSHYAHSKGMLASDEHQGFWLIHTVPHFAPSHGSYSYVASGGRYGQVAMCISLSIEELTKVVDKNFLTAQPYVYHLHIASKTNNFGKALQKLKDEEWIKTNKYVDINLTSLGGVNFRSFYKSPGDHIDLYAGIVATSVNSPLLVETWRRNPGGVLESECSHPKTKVENVEEIKLSFKNSKEVGNFSYKDDHSKWAISGTKASSKLVCLGDINRMHSQFKRGGGTTCLSIPSVWDAFNSFVSDIEKCNVTNNQLI
ncbi:hypothetical protein RDWZM_008806 [Blomia tropicalis]|uniref:Uncharacterized protein n=1 Tax=Blomia tropicalis TaxID=40697 RepID=A0A9Q0M215_BLOTA|nr:hypothetical protein RDWZM_008806 [Blomia tropicalis]